jgi:hypothetical protein
MINIRTHIKPFTFTVNTRRYEIDFVYRILCIDDESGAGKSLFVKDIVNKQNLSLNSLDGTETFDIVNFSGHTQAKLIYDYISHNNLDNKLIIVDDTEYLDAKGLLNGISRTSDGNTQWLLLGHGNFVGIEAVDAIRHIDIVTKNKYKLISFKF